MDKETWLTADDFNSHAHVERDYILNTNLQMTVISTHTLTWSVTSVGIGNFTNEQFQLTRSRGA